MAQFPAEAIVDLRAIGANLRAVRRRIGAGVKIAACVKADAYGHGLEAVSRAVARSGADMLAVANAAEAERALKAVAPMPVLVFGNPTNGEMEELIRFNARLTVSSREDLQRAELAAARLGMIAVVHVKVDTGMGRMGVVVAEAEGLIEAVCSSPLCRLEGVYTHFSTSDEPDLGFSCEQMEAFNGLLRGLSARAIKVPIAHAANSGAILGLPKSFYDMVRPGIMLYGYYPSAEASRAVELLPALTLKTRVLAVRSIQAGAPISYGRTFVAPREMRVAVLAIGYGDGYPRALSNRAQVAIRGRFAPVVGRICMDLTMADVTEIEGVAFGDEAVIYSPNREDPNSVENTASLLGTIPYEIVCRLTSRVRRVYLD